MTIFNPQKTALVFPGQGSQAVGMAAEFMALPETKSLFECADDTLGFSLSKMMAQGPSEELSLTHNTQPALLLASYASFVYLSTRVGKDIQEIATLAAGHSLGEYSALLAAGVFDLETALKLVRLRGEAMQRAVPVGQGAMAAIIGLDFNTLQNLVEETQGCWLANDNSDAQMVVSGEVEAVEALRAKASAAGAKRALLLDVSAPFHCPLMQNAAEEMAAALSSATFYAPKVDVIHNVSVKAESDPVKIRENLVAQVTGSVRWRETMSLMAEKGIETTLELGSGKVLTGLIKRGVADCEAIALNTPADIDALLEKWAIKAAS